jgi:hypothetical protein
MLGIWQSNDVQHILLRCLFSYGRTTQSESGPRPVELLELFRLAKIPGPGDPPLRLIHPVRRQHQHGFVRMEWRCFPKSVLLGSV